jgi:hypothetical protein
MKKIFNSFLVVAMMAAVATTSSCTKTCDPGYEGSDCKTEQRTKYFGTYSLSGTDNGTPAGTYTNVNTTVSTSSTGVQNLNILIGSGISLQIKLDEAGTAFTVVGPTSGNFTYTGTGSFTSSSLTLVNLTETKTSDNTVLVYNLSGAKQ